MKSGVYEHIINKETERDILQAEQSGLVCVQQPIDNAESPQILANYLAKAIRQKLEDIEEQQDRVNLINRIMIDAGLIDDKQIAKPSELLAEVMSQQTAILQTQSNSHTVRPISGFRVSNLFTGGSSTLSLNEEIRREVASADEICFIVSFLKVSGVRLLLDDLTKFCNREGTRLRIITTTYCGATQAKAIVQLAELPNTGIRISYNTNVERLHAKSYIFVRNSGMNTAYIGSSNLSKSAQTEGLEWNMRVTSIENPHIIKTALATFEMYWNSHNFEGIKTTPLEIKSIPGLELYGCYTREEVFTLVGRQTAEVKMQVAASGVFNLQEHNATLLFVTLNKSEKDFSPSTQYNDYLINEEFFHWQSQNTDSHKNNGGRRYTEQSQTKNNIILFVR